ncbi:hypothetical protein [Streptomyces sp. NRRL S-37]|uniref:hypothetical protein n=1 Tax=Streptomyces sp. NRRL S-37 TaxID=1463903 RepID=UPI00131BC820|nr:hypothetical protein [Streptomyces sp. NRRL S-37]
MEGMFVLLPPTAVVAGVALFFTIRLARKQRYEQRHELARQIINDLTTESAVKDRHLLGCLHWQNRPIKGGNERDAVMRAYFSMLWLFGRLQAGRSSLLATNNNKRDDALKYLDEGIQTHILEYICTFNEVRKKLEEADPSDKVYEGSYADAFRDLRESFAETVEDEAVKRMLTKGHVNNAEQCICSCHAVQPKRTSRLSVA